MTQESEQKPKPPAPTPDDPRQHEPIQDPPVNPDRDIEEDEPVRQRKNEVILDVDEIER